MRIAIVGTGISGLGCAHALRRVGGFDITVYEAATRLGGHTNTVDVVVDGKSFAVDTGFLVFNERAYPNLIRLFGELDVPIAASEMTFAVSLPVSGRFGTRSLEWCDSNLNGVFAQRRNLASPTFWRMLADIVRFNRQAARVAQTAEASEGNDISLGEFLDQHRFSEPFRNWYLLPMAGAIWCCPPATMVRCPLRTFVRFCHNHGLLQLTGRPRWFTVRGGARQYVLAIADRLPDVRLDDPVLAVERNESSGQVQVTSRHGRENFDHVVLACHGDQALRLLLDADFGERSLLAPVRFLRNRAVLHTDIRLLPQRRSVWSALNYMSSGSASPDLSVTYLLNKLQPLPTMTPVLLTLNPLRVPDPARTIAEFDYEHPIFDAAAIAALRRLPKQQGRRRLWFAGAWTGYGFHEDGLHSGQAVAQALYHLTQGLLPPAGQDAWPSTAIAA
jgi:predicted NAD/FAD-binding protein